MIGTSGTVYIGVLRAGILGAWRIFKQDGVWTLRSEDAAIARYFVRMGAETARAELYTSKAPGQSVMVSGAVKILREREIELINLKIERKNVPQ